MAARLMVFKICVELGRIKWSRECNLLKDHPKAAVFTEVAQFFLELTLLKYVCKPLVNLKISDTVNFDHFTDFCFLFLNGEQIYGGSHSIVPEVSF